MQDQCKSPFIQTCCNQFNTRKKMAALNLDYLSCQIIKNINKYYALDHCRERNYHSSVVKLLNI